MVSFLLGFLKYLHAEDIQLHNTNDHKRYNKGYISFAAQGEQERVTIINFVTI